MTLVAVVLAYEPEDVPHSKETLTEDAVPRADRLPLRVAEVVEMPVALLVATEGGVVADLSMVMVLVSVLAEVPVRSVA